MPLKRLGPTGTVLAVVALLGGLWVVLNTSLAAAVAGPVAMLTANLRLVAGLVVIGLIGYWALDELEDDDEFTDAVEKTGERASTASRGFINTTTVVLGTVATVLFGFGDALIDVLGQAPAFAGQFIIGILGIGGASGLLSVEVLAVLAVLVIIATGVAKGADG